MNPHPTLKAVRATAKEHGWQILTIARCEKPYAAGCRDNQVMLEDRHFKIRTKRNYQQNMLRQMQAMKNLLGPSAEMRDCFIDVGGENLLMTGTITCRLREDTPNSTKQELVELTKLELEVDLSPELG
jgi:hypothetical protein